MEWYLNVIRDNYANFNGRASRKQYWMFTLFNLIFAIAALIIDNIIGTTFNFGVVTLPYGWLYLIYGLGVFIPTFAVFIRRLHDVGKSGWWIFLGIIPIIGGIWLLILACTAGEPGDNNYGPSPDVV